MVDDEDHSLGDAGGDRSNEGHRTNIQYNCRLWQADFVPAVVRAGGLDRLWARAASPDPDRPATPAPGRRCPRKSVKYVRRIEELVEAPATLLSTSPERDDTILVRDPFEA
jgi:hypothetical protein